MSLEKTQKSLNSLTVNDLAPVDHYQPGGFLATVQLGDSLPIKANQHILGIGCGLGGPARYFAQRFGTGSYGAVGWACNGIASKMESDAKFRDRVGSIRRTCQQKI